MSSRTHTRTTSATSSWCHALTQVPARIMAPRLILLAVTAALVCFGLIMIFSASSAESFAESGDAASYVKRQLMFVGMGLFLAACTSLFDYHKLCGSWLKYIWLLTIALLAAVWLMGSGANGATRWIELGPVRLQPSEFAKITLLLAATNIADALYVQRGSDLKSIARHIVFYLIIPMGLILVQPDKGSTGIIFLMLIVMALTAGFPKKYLIAIFCGAGVIALIIVLVDSYALQRVLTMFDPWLEPLGAGYQLTRGFMAFGSGGWFGRGLGMSRMKYSYLPEAHNDFIFSIIGEECGFVGTLMVLLLFAIFIAVGLKIAQSASDKMGRLLATGAVTLITVQFFLNVLGVLGLFPLSGKPLPFLSYGGSSIMSCLGLVGIILNVSLRSELPQTVHDERRRAMSLAPDEEDTGVGPARARSRFAAYPRNEEGIAQGYGQQPSASRSSTPLIRTSTARRGFKVVEGGSSASEAPFERINLGPSASERLRNAHQTESSDGSSAVRHTTSGHQGTYRSVPGHRLRPSRRK